MKDIYEKFLSSCTIENQKIIKKYIKKTSIELNKNNPIIYYNPSDSSLYEMFGISFYNGYSELKEKDISVSLGHNKVRLTSEIIIDKNHSFYISIFIEIKQKLEYEYNISLLIDSENSKLGPSHFEVEFALDPNGTLYKLSVINTLKINIKTNINWHDPALVDFIFNNYANPEPIKQLSGLLHDLDYDNDDILKLIYKSSILLENNNAQLKLKEKLK